MCGICGLIAAGKRTRLDRRLLREMSDSLTHRGPDDEGALLLREADPRMPLHVGLAHRRLSIIDVAGGHQPMSNEDESVWVVYNGECYNFPELYPWLESRGHQFRTRCDTEALVHLYEELGPAMVERLRGMFAFAIWDRNARRLLLARDRLGQKPLFYWHDAASGDFAFASELKALLRIPGIPKDVSDAAIHDYLTYQYVPHPQCIFKHLSKLPPAHVLVYERGRVSVRRYWRPEYRPDRVTSPVVLAERVEETLMEATRIRLMSDVPLGAFLSGGIDSSLTVALMTILTGRPVKTFSIGFDEKKYDETSFARMVAQRYGSEHHEQIVRPSAMEVLPKLVWHYDEPFSDSSAIPTYYVSRHAAEHVKVVLTGDAGDETFAGYPRYVAALVSLWVDRLAGPLKRLLTERLIGAIPASSEPKTIPRRLKRFCYGLTLAPSARYLRWVEKFSDTEKTALYSYDFRSRIFGLRSLDFLDQYYGECGHGDFVHQTTYVDLMSYLPCDINNKVDIASMANSLETRSPFLDHKLVELAGTIPIEHKLRLTPRGIVGKYILKQTFADKLPGPILHRAKMGFGVPISQWFRRELKDLAWNVLTDARTRGRDYFDPRAVETLLNDHFSGARDNGDRLWTLLMLELWHRRFLDGEAVAL